MAYADSAYYKDTFKGSEIPDDQLAQRLESASDDIDAMTFNRIGGSSGFQSLTAFQQEKVHRAVCLQAEFQHNYGDQLNNSISAYGINGVTMQWDKTVLIQQGDIWTSKSVIALLRQTGLTFRGVMV